MRVAAGKSRHEHAGVTMYAAGGYAVCDDKGPRLETMDALLPGKADG